MIKRRHIGIYLILAMLGGGLIFSSCNKEEVISQPQKETEKSDIIKFGINLSELWTPDIIGGPAGENSQATEGASANASPTASGTKSTEPVLLDCKDGNGPATKVYMYMIEEDMPEVLDTVATKADPNFSLGIFAYKVPTGSLNNQENVTPSYNPAAQGVEKFMDNIGLVKDEEGLTYGTGPQYWPGAAWYMQFYVYSPYLPNGDGNTIVSHESTTSLQPKFSYTVPTEVEQQLDLMDGKSTFRIGSNTDPVNITLTHLLSQISVNAGSLAEGKIKSITLNNIYNHGERIMASPLNNGGWTVTNTGASCTSDYEMFTSTNGEDVSTLNNKPIKTMYLMPQTLSDEATIELVLEVESDNPASTGENDTKRTHEYTLTKKLSTFTETWAPDKKYTYIISTPEEVEVEVTDKVNDNGDVKSDLVIKNTGLSPVYIRAALIGNWVIPNETERFEDDIIVADWNPAPVSQNGDGDFIWGEDNEGAEPSNLAKKGWYKHTDGYYYHLNIVPSGKETAKLFDTYTLKSAPIAGAVLDLTVVVQAVQASDVNLVWLKGLNKFINTPFVASSSN